jgi:hypothetical protein
LPVFSPVIGIFGYSKPIAKIANEQRSIGNLGNGKTNCQDCQWSDRPTALRIASPGMDCHGN